MSIVLGKRFYDGLWAANRFINARRKPSVMKAPGGKTITRKGKYPGPKTGTLKRVPLPKTSRMEPNTRRDSVKPSPIPNPSAKESMRGFFEAKASALPRMMQLTTIRGIKRPKVLWS